MTSKDICKKCINDERTIPDDSWDDNDEMRWLQGKVWCFLHNPAGGAHVVSYDDPEYFPPTECPYAAEHVVLREAG